MGIISRVCSSAAVRCCQWVWWIEPCGPETLQQGQARRAPYGFALCTIAGQVCIVCTALFAASHANKETCTVANIARPGACRTSSAVASTVPPIVVCLLLTDLELVHFVGRRVVQWQTAHLRRPERERASEFPSCPQLRFADP